MANELTWHDVLAEEKQQPYFLNTLQTVASERQSGVTIYPPQKDVFNAFRFTELGDVKVVILGQDPYHGPGQAHGLCFSVKRGVTPPPSLVNIYKERESDLGIPPSTSGDLRRWAEQGVLLLGRRAVELVVAGAQEAQQPVAQRREVVEGRQEDEALGHEPHAASHRLRLTTAARAHLRVEHVEAGGTPALAGGAAQQEGEHARVVRRAEGAVALRQEKAQRVAGRAEPRAYASAASAARTREVRLHGVHLAHALRDLVAAIEDGLEDALALELAQVHGGGGRRALVHAELALLVDVVDQVQQVHAPEGLHHLRPHLLQRRLRF